MSNIQFLIIFVTGFFILNVYHDGKYIEILKSGKKYYIMVGYAFIGLSIYLLMKNNPQDGAKLVSHATNMIKFMPIDKDSSDLLSPALNHASNYLAQKQSHNTINYDDTLYETKKTDNRANSAKKTALRI